MKKKKEQRARGGDGALHLPLYAEHGVDDAGGLITEAAGMCVNYIPLSLRPGDRLCPRDSRLRYRLYWYSEQVDPALIYTYCYAREGNWTTYCPEKSPDFWMEGELQVGEAGYARLVFRPAEGAEFLDDCFFLRRTETETPEPEWIAAEAERLAERFRAAKPGDGLRFFLLGDSHYCIGGNWEDTLAGLRRSAELIRPDLTDGTVPLRQMKSLAGRVLEDLRSLGIPLYLCLGNHDENYFRGNPERMNKQESARWYFHRRRSYYRVDLDSRRLRLYFLDSFDPAKKERYGFSLKEYLWFRRSLLHIPPGWRVLIFSHVPPLPEIHVWSREIRLGPAMLRALEAVARSGKNPVLGWIHGHNHADQIFQPGRVPVIGIGCSKLESFPEHKPEGSRTWQRKRGCPEQELWDAVLVPDGENRLYLFRFGAGRDRRVPE